MTNKQQRIRDEASEILARNPSVEDYNEAYEIAERMFAECLNENDECEGLVEYHSTGSSMKSWPRCDFHQAKREDAYENSMEKYADSDVAPAWFDPTYAGESW
jgi:hypothetical protein